MLKDVSKVNIVELIEKFPEFKDIAVFEKIASLHGWTVNFNENRFLDKSGIHDKDKLLDLGIHDYKPHLKRIWIFVLAHEIGHIISNCDLSAYLLDRQIMILEEIKAWRIAFNLLKTYLPHLTIGRNLLDFINDSQFSINTYVKEPYSNSIENHADYGEIVFRHYTESATFRSRKFRNVYK